MYDVTFSLLQSKGRLNEDSLRLLQDTSILVDDAKRKFLGKAANFPLEVLYLRDDDIPGVVSAGAACLSPFPNRS